MAKQTFTVGQVLTAAQLTSLQQTAMGGGAASAKTASYTLVAADAGTTISMTSTSATTITVNTGLFAAGDTVFIQNLGSGNCTVTAGTATVSTAGSTILPTNDAGILYFVSTGVAIFYDFIQTGAVSPLTTKGDLYGFSTLDARIPIGANNTVLTADSNETLGLKWAAPAGGGGLVWIGNTTFTSTTTVNVNDVFSTTYDYYRVIITATATTANPLLLRLRVSGTDTTTNYYTQAVIGDDTSAVVRRNYTGTDDIQLGDLSADAGSAFVFDVMNPYLASATGFTISNTAFFGGTSIVLETFAAYQSASTSFTGFTLLSTNNATGTLSVYGYAKA